MKYFFFRLLTVFLLCLFVRNNFIYAQEKDKNILAKEYYDFFNSLVNRDSIHRFNLESKPDLSYIIKDTSILFQDTTLFSSADIQFIKDQIIAAQTFKWKPGKILGAWVISSKKIASFFEDAGGGWTEFNKKYENGFVSFSVPLFTIDKNVCIVYKAEHCGNLCGHGSTSIYRKVNGKWIFIQSVGTVWMS